MGNSIISARIKETRIDKKLSQEELSEKSGLSLRTIQRLENGESVPRGDTNYFNNSLFENNDKGDNKNLLVVPWFLIGCFIICGSIGFILSIVLVMVNVIPYGEFGLPLLIAITLLFCGIGFVIGNYIEKKYRK
jgi:DNA-binding XRE family transcriptional regulator